MAQDDALLDELYAFSTVIGNDPRIVQGAGGNVSCKGGSGGRAVLHIKASGLWLGRMARQTGFVALDLDAARDCLRAADREPDLSAFIIGGSAGVRPSIETSLHAVMPHRVVVHTHSVNALACLVRPDSQAMLAGLLDGLVWRHVPYARPGLPLTRAIEAAGGLEADVLMLANHGIVLGAADVEDAVALHDEVEARLQRPVREAAAGQAAVLKALCAALGLHGLGWRPAEHAVSDGLATDPVSLRFAGAGTLYPDHVVFLGAGGLRAARAEDAVAVIRADPSLKLLLVEGVGVLMADTLGEAADEMVRCLALVLARCNEAARLRTLRPEDEGELVDWEAEAYRRKLSRQQAPAP